MSSNPPTLTPLAAYLRARMAERNLSPSQLAERADLSKQTVSLILSGQIRNPSGKVICKLRDGVGVEYNDLMPAVCETVRAA